MNTSSSTPVKQEHQRQIKGRFGRLPLHLLPAFLVGLLSVVGTAPAPADAAVEVAKAPLYLARPVPGNLVLTPSVENPTINRPAYPTRTYVQANKYIGYFDSEKCYQYVYSSTESQRYFNPTRFVTGHGCSAAAKEWSGNFLNWATMQAIDGFRMGLTGGYRTTDTVAATVLEKARNDGQWNLFPTGSVSGATASMPLTGSWATSATSIRINRLGNRMWFSRRAASDSSMATNSTVLPGDSTVLPYNPAAHALNGNEIICTQYYGNGSCAQTAVPVFEVSVRVKVCVPGLLESNCVGYPKRQNDTDPYTNYKPEGLLQKYSDRLTYSVFGYMNDPKLDNSGDQIDWPASVGRENRGLANSPYMRNGAALRAKQKFVGPERFYPEANYASVNPAAEWDKNTGVMIRNPDALDAAATGSNILDSGVINYLNKFGQMTTMDHKSGDNVSEMYSTALRYLMNQGNVAAYTDARDVTTRYNEVDGFPVVTSWDDPIRYRCQSNTILGIGDTNTQNDNTIDAPLTTIASDYTSAITSREGGTFITASGRSAYIAGLAYFANTQDIRSPTYENDLPNLQTAQTYWVDVQENATLAGRQNNMYWMAAKYGGLKIPSGTVFDYVATGTTIQPSWWTDSVTAAPDTLSNGDTRPRNFFVGSDAEKMVNSLTSAFAALAPPKDGTGAGLASTGMDLVANSKVFRSSYRSGSWSGDVVAFNASASSEVVGSQVWSAASLLAARNWATRQIYVAANATGNSWVKLGVGTSNIVSGLGVASADQTKVVDYLRGDRTNETSAGGLRIRTSVLGDIINSQPLYVAAPASQRYIDPAYATHAAATAGRKKMVYVGANDGMLHAFNADTGDEVFAYMPRSAINPSLAAYTRPGYGDRLENHRYFVDGELTAAEVKVGGAWKTVLIGTMGRGGPGIFAIDITNPDSPALMWDLKSSDIPELGMNLGKPIIAEVSAGNWRVILGNGPNSVDGKAQLITINVSDGSYLAKKVSDDTNNALSAVLVWNSNPNTGISGDNYFETAYAGDLLGTMWKFKNIGTAAMSVTKVAEVKGPTNKPQPITAAPTASVRPGTNETWIFFGTGRYLNESDNSNQDVQSWYGIIDGDTPVTSRDTQLVQRSIIYEGLSTSGRPVRAVSAGNASEMTDKRGWYMDLISPRTGATNGGKEGERIVLPNLLDRGSLKVDTRIPDMTDPCNPGGRSFSMAIDPYTGGRLGTSMYDVNGDGTVNDSDNAGGFPNSGVGHLTGMNQTIMLGADKDVGVRDDTATTTTNTDNSAAGRAIRVAWRELVGG